jgi:beta-glucosidase-like glycosyl hydrolase
MKNQNRPQDVADTYLPAFDACVRAARTQGIMCAYNAVDGTPMCSNAKELRGRLRAKWGFDGYVVSDCNAVSAFVWGHRSAADDAAAIAAAIRGGTDLLCDNMNTEKARPARVGGRGRGRGRGRGGVLAGSPQRARARRASRPRPESAGPRSAK